jgi:mono/diheme cytochrome c family protein
MRFFQHRVALLSACLPMAIAITGCSQPPANQQATPSAAPPAATPAQTPAERGKMLVIGGGCHDCHTTKKPGPGGPEPDLSLMLSGHPETIKITAPFKPATGSPWTIATNDTLTAWSGPWGVSFAANLTPDKETGLHMNEKNFVTALKTGSHLGTARPILPPMPWAWYSQLSEDDLKAIFAYLQTIPAIKNEVPAPLPPAGAPPAGK